MVTWEAPGPGYWELDRSHFVGGETPLIQHIQTRRCRPACAGFSPNSARPPTRSTAAFVNGFMYTRLRPLIAADRPAKKLPPRFVMKAVARFHPEFRRRTKAAEKAQCRAAMAQGHRRVGARRAGADRVAQPRPPEGRPRRTRRLRR